MGGITTLRMNIPIMELAGLIALKAFQHKVLLMQSNTFRQTFCLNGEERELI